MARRKGSRGERKASASTSTRYWSRCIPTLESPARPWASWTRSSTTSSRGSPASRLVSPTTTSARPSAAARSRPPSGSCCPANWPSTPCLKAPKPSPSTPALSRWLCSTPKIENNGPCKGHPLLCVLTCLLSRALSIQLFCRTLLFTPGGKLRFRYLRRGAMNETGSCITWVAYLLWEVRGMRIFQTGLCITK